MFQTESVVTADADHVLHGAVRRILAPLEACSDHGPAGGVADVVRIRGEYHGADLVGAGQRLRIDRRR
jgi:hypothetical protein